MRALPVAVLVATSLATMACGGAPPARSTPSEGASPPPATALAGDKSAPVRTTSLRRSEVKQSIGKGLGHFLQNVTVEDWPAMQNGKFHGFKIRTITADWGVDLRPGDVVMRVNGLPIEHPEEADAALRSLEKARSLKVDYEREGKARTLELPITED